MTFDKQLSDSGMGPWPDRVVTRRRPRALISLLLLRVAYRAVVAFKSGYSTCFEPEGNSFFSLPGFLACHPAIVLSLVYTFLSEGAFAIGLILLAHLMLQIKARFARLQKNVLQVII